MPGNPNTRVKKQTFCNFEVALFTSSIEKTLISTVLQTKVKNKIVSKSSLDYNTQFEIKLSKKALFLSKGFPGTFSPKSN